MNDIKDEKSIIRKKQKIIRDKIFNNKPSHFALTLFNELFEKINFQEINIVSSFISINSEINTSCLLYTSPSPRDISGSRMPSSA